MSVCQLLSLSSRVDLPSNWRKRKREIKLNCLRPTVAAKKSLAYSWYHVARPLKKFCFKHPQRYKIPTNDFNSVTCYYNAYIYPSSQYLKLITDINGGNICIFNDNLHKIISNKIWKSFIRTFEITGDMFGTRLVPSRSWSRIFLMVCMTAIEFCLNKIFHFIFHLNISVSNFYVTTFIKICLKNLVILGTCLKYAYFNTVFSLNMLIAFMFIKKECRISQKTMYCSYQIDLTHTCRNC